MQLAQYTHSSLEGEKNTNNKEVNKPAYVLMKWVILLWIVKGLIRFVRILDAHVIMKGRDKH